MRATVRDLVLVASLAFVGFGVAACGATSAADRETTLPKAQTSKSGPKDPAMAFNEAMKRGDDAFVKRDQRPDLEKALAAYHEAAKANPKDPGIWVKLSRATYLLADGFVSFDKDKGDAQMKQYLKLHEDGIVYAKRALLAYSEDFQKRMQAGTKLEDALPALDKGAVPGLYWMSSNYGKWAVAKGFTTILKYKDLIKKVMSKCLKENPDYFFAGPDRYFGAFYAKAPSIAGGDMDKSKTHFDASLKKAPNYFGTKVLLAQYWAKKKDDRKLFEKLLNEVLKGDPTAQPGAAPENKIEQKKAKALLAKVNDLF